MALQKLIYINFNRSSVLLKEEPIAQKQLICCEHENYWKRTRRRSPYQKSGDVL